MKLANKRAPHTWENSGQRIIKSGAERVWMIFLESRGSRYPLAESLVTDFTKMRLRIVVNIVIPTSCKICASVYSAPKMPSVARVTREARDPPAITARVFLSLWLLLLFLAIKSLSLPCDARKVALVVKAGSVVWKLWCCIIPFSLLLAWLLDGDVWEILFDIGALGARPVLNPSWHIKIVVAIDFANIIVYLSFACVSMEKLLRTVCCTGTSLWWLVDFCPFCSISKADLEVTYVRSNVRDWIILMAEWDLGEIFNLDLEFLLTSSTRSKFITAGMGEIGMSWDGDRTKPMEHGTWNQMEPTVTTCQH